MSEPSQVTVRGRKQRASPIVAEERSFPAGSGRVIPEHRCVLPEFINFQPVAYDGYERTVFICRCSSTYWVTGVTRIDADTWKPTWVFVANLPRNGQHGHVPARSGPVQ